MSVVYPDRNRFLWTIDKGIYCKFYSNYHINNRYVLLLMVFADILYNV